MTENRYFKVGNVLSPLQTSTGNTALKDLDPGLWNILRFYYYTATVHATSRWNEEIAAVGLSDYLNKVIAQVIPYDPLPLSTESQYKFPLLVGYRTKEEYDWKSIVHYQIKSEVDILYILPPLSSPTQLKALTPFLTHVARIFVDRTTQGSDEQVNNQKQYWQDAGIQTIGCKRTRYGNIPGDTNIFFPTIQMTLNLEERHTYPSEPGFNFEELTRLDFDLDLRDGYEDGYADYDFADIHNDI